MYEYRTASVLAFTETWLNENDSNDALHIDGFGSPIRLERDSALTGKHHGRGVCIYANTNWCSSVVVREEFLSQFLSYWFTSTPKRKLLLPLSMSRTL